MLIHATHLLLDAARADAAMNIARQRAVGYESLYRTTADAHLEGIAPFLFPFHIMAPLGLWYARAGWGKAWGVMLKSSWPISELSKHFRKFLKVQTDAGQTLRFRFYDPRVLRIFLPTCDAAQLRDFFGNGAVDYFIVEDEDPAFALRMGQENGMLKTERFPVAEAIAALPEPEPLPQKAEQDELTPETLAIIAELRKQYPDLVFPGDEQQDANANEKKAAGPEQARQPQPATQSTPQPMPPQPPKKPAFSIFAEEEEAPSKAPQELPKEPPQPSPKPDASKLKPKWNLFD